MWYSCRSCILKIKSVKTLLYINQIVAKVLSSSKTAYSVYLFEWLTAAYEERVAAKKKGLSGY